MTFTINGIIIKENSVNRKLKGVIKMKEEMEVVFNDLTENNKTMMLMLGQAIKLAQEEKQNEKTKETA